MKKIAILAICLLGGPLFGQTDGDVEFQFPPSKNEWKLLIHTDSETLFDDEDEDLGEEFEIELDHFKLSAYLHREGDALETFTVMTGTDKGDDEEDIQKFLNETVGKLFSNHSFVVNTLVENDFHTVSEWELKDEMGDLLHGYVRKIGLSDERCVVIGYTTTALKTELNRYLWISMLNQARVLN